MFSLAKIKVNLCSEAKLVETKIFQLCALQNFSCIHKIGSKDNIKLVVHFSTYTKTVYELIKVSLQIIQFSI